MADQEVIAEIWDSSRHLNLRITKGVEGYNLPVDKTPHRLKVLLSKDGKILDMKLIKGTTAEANP